MGGTVGIGLAGAGVGVRARCGIGGITIGVRGILGTVIIVETGDPARTGMIGMIELIGMKEMGLREDMSGAGVLLGTEARNAELELSSGIEKGRRGSDMI